MGCDQYREALSALMDGETPDVPAEAVRAHVRSCPACAGWEEEARRVGRLVRLAPAGPMPDLAPLVAGAVRPARRRAATAVRAALAVVAVVQAMLAWSGALTGQDSMASGHLAEETGAWNLALAVAFLAAATRPRTAAALVAPIGVFVAVLFVTVAGDVVAGTVDGARLSGHLLVAVGLGLLVAVSRTDAADPDVPPARSRTPRPAPPPDPAADPRLHLVPAGPATPAGGPGTLGSAA
ncbi:MAG TPA: zf-HC2 domain-containing protein [Mycobacteriales bacterium]